MKKPSNAHIIKAIWPNPFAMPIIFIIAGIIGFVLGALVIYIVLKHFRKNMHIDMKLGLFLVLLDTFSALEFLFSGVANLPRFQLYAYSKTACLIQEAWASTTFLTSMNLIGVIALERCLLIVYNIKLKDSHYWIMVFICYLVPVFNAILVISTDSVELQNIGVLCHYSSHTWYGIAAFLIMMVSSSISFLLLIVCYIKIVYFRRAHAQREQIELGLDPVKVRRAVNRTTLKLVMVLVINIATNVPYCVYQFIGLFTNGIYTSKVAFFVIPPCMMDIVWNTVIFLILHSDIAKKLKSEWI